VQDVFASSPATSWFGAAVQNRIQSEKSSGGYTEQRSRQFSKPEDYCIYLQPFTVYEYYQCMSEYSSSMYRYLTYCTLQVFSASSSQLPLLINPNLTELNSSIVVEHYTIHCTQHLLHCRITVLGRLGTLVAITI